MGRLNEFRGGILFQNKLTAEQEVDILDLFRIEDGKFCIKEFGDFEMTPIPIFSLTHDKGGFEWDGGNERVYDIGLIIERIVKGMDKKYPQFRVFGEIYEIGGDYVDHYVIADDGITVERG